MMKSCNCCFEMKPYGEFHSNGYHPSGSKKYKPTCKKCELEATYERYVGIIKAFFGALACKKCGYDEHFAALQLHHRDPKEKEYSISRMRNYSEEKIIAELGKCDILCANCHALVHAKRYELVGEE